MSPGVNDESIAGIIDIVNDDGSFQGIDYEDLSREAGFPHGRDTRNLFSLARAYKTESSGYYRDETSIYSFNVLIAFRVLELSQDFAR